ncbi:MAG: PEP-CTERM sorting domain-containing protein [Planctomycetota bacterium]|jgi:hypothetical protein
MKRAYVVSLLTALFISSVTTAGVNITLSSPADGLVTIGYQADENSGIRGLSLNIQLSDNATAIYTDIVSIHSAFNAFPDYYNSHPGYLDTIDDPLEMGGHPFANTNNKGSIEEATSAFSLSMGVLDHTGNQLPAPDVIENLITFRIQDGGTGSAYVTLSADTLRGGIVGDNIGTITMPQPLLVTIPEPATLTLLGLGGLLLKTRRKPN